MKKELTIAVSYEMVKTTVREIELSETPRFFSKNDDGNFFPRGLILFAILPKYESNPTQAYTLVQVEENKQEYNDFVPTDDLKQKYWLSESGVRKVAFEIFSAPKYLDGWTEISKEEFDEKRVQLLNKYQQYYAKETTAEKV